MKATNPCGLCGSKDLDLVDGFYYCVECGTQDTNVRETIVEHTILANGTFAQTTKRKIIKIDDQKEMSPEWYKWHTYNFILCGLADELIALGAAPTFKTKLLWIWSRYIKKHQKTEELGLSNANASTSATLLTFEPEDISNGELEEERTQKEKDSKKYSLKSAQDIKVVTPGLLMTMLYVSLNLDKSDLQISHLKRFIDEGRLNSSNFDRHIPEGIKVNAIGPDWLYFRRGCKPMFYFSIIRYRTVAMSLFKELDLGSPLLPDMRKIVNNFITELCLPNEFRNLVYSLMHHWPCSFLDVDSRGQRTLSKVPEYEGVAMAYILVGLKMCFGLDGVYEYELSDFIDSINEKELSPKSYKLGFTPEPTGRLFSFRDWICYLQFRRKMLSKHLQLNVDEEHYNDIDEYVFVEHLPERAQGKVSLTDELTMKIVDNIPVDGEINVIPKNELPVSLTPMSAYTEILTQNCTDSETVQLLSEDFTQYSLKYACENLNLFDTENNKNIIVGVIENKKMVTGGEVLGNIKPVKSSRLRKWVYIRNCENKNWMKTNKPAMDHVSIRTNDKEHDNKDDKESDHGYDSNIENTPSDDFNAISSEISELKLETIMEEDIHKNIFDDTFDDLDYKKEVNAEDDHNFDDVQEQIELDNEQLEQSDAEDDKSVSSAESYEFNPETFNRERAIKELILKACKKYKIPIPKEYKTVEPRKRKHYDEPDQPRRKYAKTERAEAKTEITKLLETYYSHVESDVVGQVAQQVRNVIQNMNITNDGNAVPPINESQSMNGLVSDNQSHINVTDNQSHINVTDNQSYINVTDKSVIEQTETENNTTKVESEQENLESTLFDDDSDIEAYIDELIPKADPKFDDNKYDVNQLYIKVDEEEPEDIFAAAQDRDIDKILEHQIEELKNKKIDIKKIKHTKTNESSDSEDELPLSTIIEERESYLKELEVENNLEALIKNESIPEFNYWLRHYDKPFMSRVQNAREKFDTEMAQNTTKSFYFVLRECAAVCGYTVFRLYKCMQELETNLTRYVRKQHKS